jgi:metallo-beta-lactamase family protein
MGEMAAAMAHELNQPLSAISNYAAACRRLLEADDVDKASITEALGRISTQAQRAAEVIRRTRDFTRAPDTKRATTTISELLPIMLYDAAFIYERDLERNNKRRKERGQETLEPAYSKADVAAAIDLCMPVHYQQKEHIHGHAAIRFHDAGHILGSAIVELMITEQGKEKTLVFSGDLGKDSTVLMKDPSVLSKANILLLESTYGNRNHRSYGDTIAQLCDILHDTWERGGNVMIPAFAVGRTQELIYHLGNLHHAGKLDRWQVFLDSPMAIEVTGVYDRWLRHLDADDIRKIDKSDSRSLEEFLPTLQFSVSQDESMAINEVQQGALIIAGSGMCTGGRIRHHFKRRIQRSENTLIFIGFQANGTLGRILVDGHKKIKLFGEHVNVAAHIETLGGFSAHAGQSELIEWASHFNHDTPVALVHGEAEGLQGLQQKLAEELGMTASIPAIGDTLQF